jgi:predicted nucleotidyltransferase
VIVNHEDKLNMPLQPVNQSILAEVVRRIVDVAHPRQIILFGSAARGMITTDSDLDILVITPGQVHRGRLTEEIYMKLFGVGQAVDVIVITDEDVKLYGKNPYMVIEPALREGKVIYDREAPIAG